MKKKIEAREDVMNMDRVIENMWLAFLMALVGTLGIHECILPFMGISGSFKTIFVVLGCIATVWAIIQTKIDCDWDYENKPAKDCNKLFNAIVGGIVLAGAVTVYKHINEEKKKEIKDWTIGRILND